MSLIVYDSVLLRLFLDLLDLDIDSTMSKVLPLVFKDLFLSFFGRHERDTGTIGRHEGVIIAGDIGRFH